MDAHATANAVLAALQPGDRPTVVQPVNVVLKPARAAFVTAASGQMMEETFASLTGRERGLFGIREQPTEPQAKDESWLERQARERAWADAHTGKGPPSFTPTADGTYRQPRRREP